ncbi:hypothetical protein [Snuella lapsa]|uniref:hypothetical protein n=1 Tax=Snuella lapsa TaxID=870481 RepID=UPI0031EAAA05
MKSKRADSNVRYFFDESGKYSHFSTGKYYFEEYSSIDSLVVDYLNFNVTRISFKFNPNNIIIYFHDNDMEYIEQKKVLNFNSEKIIKTVETYGRISKNDNFVGGITRVLNHDNNGNLIDIKHFEDTGEFYPDFILEHIADTSNFTFFEHNFPNLAISRMAINTISSELFIILYNKGYRFSKKGVKSYDEYYPKINSKYSGRFELQYMYPTEVNYIEYNFNHENQTEWHDDMFDTFIEFEAL